MRGHLAVADHLERGPVTLLARTDTRVLRAYIGRTGWSPPEGSVLVEPVEPAAGLLATLERLAPRLAVLVVPRVASSSGRQPIAV